MSERSFRALVCRWYTSKSLVHRTVHVDRESIRFSTGFGREYVYGRLDVVSIAQHHRTPGASATAIGVSVGGTFVLEVQMTDGQFGRYCLKPANVEDAVEVLAEFNWPIKVGFPPRLRS